MGERFYLSRWNGSCVYCGCLLILPLGSPQQANGLLGGQCDLTGSGPRQLGTGRVELLEWADAVG